MSSKNRKLPALPPKALEKQALAESRMAARAKQEEATGYAGHGRVAMHISPAPPFIAGAALSEQASTAKLVEDIATAKMVIRHRTRCAALQRRSVGRPFDWGRLLLTLGVIDTPFLQRSMLSQPKKPTVFARQNSIDRKKHYNKTNKPLVEQITHALGCNEETAKDFLRQTRLLLNGWKIALPNRQRGKWVPYTAARFKSGGIKKT